MSNTNASIPPLNLVVDALVTKYPMLYEQLSYQAIKKRATLLGSDMALCRMRRQTCQRMIWESCAFRHGWMSTRT